MSDQPTFAVPQSDETTGRYVVTFRDDNLLEGLSALKQDAGLSKLPTAADFSEGALDPGQVDAAGGAVFSTLGVAVVTLDEGALSNMMSMRTEDSPILDIEPERIFYATGNGILSGGYLKGYRDAVNDLFDRSTKEDSDTAEYFEPAVTYVDDSHSTWGLKATNVVNSRWTGRGIRVAVLDTGLDLLHPDFQRRAITSKSFYQGETPQDRLGHGTHCTGTACGFKDNNGRRYGVAYESEIFVGKVLGGPFGSGSTSSILAGIEWAINNRCAVISMSLGNRVKTRSTAYEVVGQRALQNGSLIVAAAGNHYLSGNSDGSRPGTVGQPANSATIMAVGAVDNRLQRANFSCVSGSGTAANVDIVGPGVNVYSSVPMPQRYAGDYSGTSMATPHVAGIAAQYAQAYRARGMQLWQLLVSHARRLPIPSSQVGSGLVQAPTI